MSASSACILIRCSSPSLLLAATRIEPGAAALKLVLRDTGYEVARNHHGRSPAPFLSTAAPADAAYQPDRKLRERALAAIATLTAQGRAVGYCVVGALQDPREGVLRIRNPFPTG
jgi:hypothetical protein